MATNSPASAASSPEQAVLNAAGFSITRLCGCAIVFGHTPGGGAPVDAIEVAMKLVDKKSLLDTRLARFFGAVWVAGSPSALEALSAHAATEAAREAYVAPIRHLLPDEAVTWLKYGDVGASSAVIFKALAGVKVPGMPHGGAEAVDTPRDVSDLRRCFLLLEKVPQFALQFADMRHVSPRWAALVAVWGDLKAALEDEAPAWRTKLTASPNTKEMLQGLLGPMGG